MEILLTPEDVACYVNFKLNDANTEFRKSYAFMNDLNTVRKNLYLPRIFGNAKIHVVVSKKDNTIYIGCDKPEVTMTEKEIIETYVIRITNDSIDFRANDTWCGYISFDFMFDLYKDLLRMNQTRVYYKSLSPEEKKGCDVKYAVNNE